jgi:peptide/nickel transport system substrate-binding protein
MVGELGIERFDGAFVTGTPMQNYMRLLHGALISDNEKKEMVPGIASQWGFSSDGLTWTFTIRKGVKWHNGSELTPEDVLWTLQHEIGPEAQGYTAPSMAVQSRKVTKIELSGPDKVSVTTKVPITELTFLYSETAPSVWAIMPKRAKLHDTADETAYDLSPVGAGPMKLVRHVKASVMKFDRFDDFYYQPKNGFPIDKRVNFQSLDLFLVPEEATRVAALRAGEADLVPANLALKKQVEAGGGRVVFSPEAVIMEVTLWGCFETRHPCHDKRVRQALDYAIDKNLMRERLWGPEAFSLKGFSYVTPNTIGYTPALDPWPFNPNKARQLLAEAGYPGGKGFGKLIINTNPGATMPLQVESAQLAADFWRKELALDVVVNVSDHTGITDKARAGELNG